MAHWRDHGIGNMAGSDDRPVEEWTLLECLRNLEALVYKHGWTTDKIVELAYRAADVIDPI